MIFKELRFSNLSNLIRIGVVEFLFAMIVLPGYLSVQYFVLNKYFRDLNSFKLYLLLSIGCLLLYARLDFTNWWNTKGKTISVKDPEARDVIEIELLLQLLLSLGVGLITLYTSKALGEKRASKSML